MKAKVIALHGTGRPQPELPGGREVVVLGGQGIGSAPRNADPLEVEKGLSVRTASLDDVIRMKEAADPMKDQRSQ
jgi:hypothetical protein